MEMSKYSIQTFQKNIDKSPGFLERLGNPTVTHDAYGVVFLRYDTYEAMRANLDKAKILLDWAVPVTEFGEDKNKQEVN